MKRFQFRLEKLLKLREREEEWKKQELAEVMGLYNKEEHGIHECMEGMKKNAEEVDALSPEEYNTVIFASDNYNSAMRAKIEGHKKQMRSLEPEIEKRRNALAEAVRNRRVVEIMKDKKIAEYKKELRKEEQAMLDEWRT